MSLELQLHEGDREKFGGPEWVPLDVDRLFDTPAQTLIRWERECDYSIERALVECVRPHPPAHAVLVMVWLARKQAPGRPHVDKNGQPESFTDLQDLRTMPVRIRAQPSEGDADPPDSATPKDSSPADASPSG